MRAATRVRSNVIKIASHGWGRNTTERDFSDLERIESYMMRALSIGLRLDEIADDLNDQFDELGFFRLERDSVDSNTIFLHID